MVGTCLKVLYVNTCHALDLSVPSLLMMRLLNKLILEFQMTCSVVYKEMPHKNLITQHDDESKSALNWMALETKSINIRCTNEVLCKDNFLHLQ